MGKFRDLTGMKFGRLVVIKRGENGNNKGTRWQCLCECGNERLVLGSLLVNGNTESCGCLNKELASKMCKEKLIHGCAINGKQSKEYRVWGGLRSRCNNPKNASYENYGGRGISVCERWNDFRNFLEDMGERPPGLEIDRIDNDGNYEPGNCRWATSKQQKENRRKPKLTKLKVQVIKKLLAESSLALKDIADIFNVSSSYVCNIKKNRFWKNVQYKPA